MRRYETVCIVNPSLSPEEAQPLFDKLTDLIAAHQGLMVKLDDWGHKRLAYVIKKQTRGYYILLNYCGNGSLVKELERNMRLDDRVLKYMTVCVAKEVDEEAIKSEIEAAEEAAKVKESTAEPKESSAEPVEEAIKTEIEAAEEAAKVKESTAEPKESSAEPVEEAEASEAQEQAPPGETLEPTPGEAEALDNAALSTEKEEELTDGKV